MNIEQLVTALADRYTIERELGQGGMATVYLARDLKHEREVAIKVLREDLSASLGAGRFLREIKIAAQLQHPHILPLLDSGEARLSHPERSEGSATAALYFVMPYIKGQSLRERLGREGELPIHEAVRLISEVVDALVEAHAHGVVHRDIKPDNVMLSGRHALVTDFGVAKAISEATGRNTVTTLGVAVGTPTYMSPEQAAADPHVDHRSDIYSVGVMLYEMLAGRPPFTGSTPQQVLAAHVTEAPDPVSKRRAAISPVLEQVVMRCLAKRPADRFQTAAELHAALEPLATPSAGVTPLQTQPISAVVVRRTVIGVNWQTGTALIGILAVMALVTLLASGRKPLLTLGKRTAVAAGPELETWPSLSPNGQLIAYTTHGSGGWKEVVRQVAGGAPVTISGGDAGSVGLGALSPQGDRLLVASPAGIQVVPSLGGQMRLVAGIGTGGSLADAFPRNHFALWAAAWSPDGTRIAYTHGDTLFTQSLNGAGRSAIATGSDLHSAAWSPDGQWIAYVEGNTEFHIDGNLAPSAIRIVRASGGTPVPITDNHSGNTSPIWVPGRDALLFISDRDGGRDIYEIYLSGSGRPAAAPVRITTGLNPERLSISADGKRLAWSVYTETANLWSLSIPTADSVRLTGAKQVTEGAQNIENVAASPDGQWLYYDSDRSGTSHIWRQRIAGGTPEMLTSDSAADFDPAISPNGQEVAFHSFRTGNRDIFVMAASGGPAAQVTTSREQDWNPSWAPDGQSLVWDRQLVRDSILWMAHRTADGRWGPAQMISPGLRSGGIPRFSPDGRWIAVRIGATAVYELATHSVHTVYPVDAFVAWSADSRTLYLATDPDSLGHWTIKRVVPTGGAARTLVYGNDPVTQGRRFGLALADGRLYFPVVERKAEIWVAEIRSK